SYFVMELCEEGSLHNYIKRVKALTPEHARTVLFQLLKVIEHLHKQNLCHRDLSAGNVLIKHITAKGPSIKICDFGLSKVMEEGIVAQTMAGTPGYMNPYIIQFVKYGKEVDLYSLGALLYLMLTGEDP
ncbi:hypothetical protein PENTCL1PPCAC_28569, partial [Pristionchus entomophagus]